MNEKVVVDEVVLGLGLLLAARLIHRVLAGGVVLVFFGQGVLMVLLGGHAVRAASRWRSHIVNAQHSLTRNALIASTLIIDLLDHSTPRTSNLEAIIRILVLDFKRNALAHLRVMHLLLHF